VCLDENYECAVPCSMPIHSRLISRMYLVFCLQIQANQLSYHRLTCVYASCKVEENHVSAEELGKGIQQDHQIILNNEMILLKVCHFHILFFYSTSKQPEYDIKFLVGFQTLDFDLIVYAPYRSIEGFIDDLEVSLYLFCAAN